MKKGKIAIIILSILLTISVIGNIVLIIKVSTTNKPDIKEETKVEEKDEIEEYNPDLKYVGKWQYGYSSELGFILSDGSSAKGLYSYDSILEIDDKLSVTMTQTKRHDCLNADGSQVLTNINKVIYKGEVSDGTIILKEMIENDNPKEEIRSIRYIVLHSDDTLAYYTTKETKNPDLYIKK